MTRCSSSLSILDDGVDEVEREVEALPGIVVWILVSPSTHLGTMPESGEDVLLLCSARALPRRRRVRPGPRPRPPSHRVLGRSRLRTARILVTREHGHECVLLPVLLGCEVRLVLNVKLVLALVIVDILLQFLETGSEGRPLVRRDCGPDVDVARVGDGGDDWACRVPLDVSSMDDTAA